MITRPLKAPIPARNTQQQKDLKKKEVNSKGIDKPRRQPMTGRPREASAVYAQRDRTPAYTVNTLCQHSAIARSFWVVRSNHDINLSSQRTTAATTPKKNDLLSSLMSMNFKGTAGKITSHLGRTTRSSSQRTLLNVRRMSAPGS